MTSKGLVRSHESSLSWQCRGWHVWHLGGMPDAYTAGLCTVHASSVASAWSSPMLTVHPSPGCTLQNGTLACGGVFRSCADPNIKDPDSQLL